MYAVTRLSIVFFDNLSSIFNKIPTTTGRATYCLTKKTDNEQLKWYTFIGQY